MPSPLSPRWRREISRGELTDALTRLALEVQPSIREQPLRQKALRRRLEKREYTLGEVLYAVDQLADDPELDDKLRYGGDLSAADFRRVIEPIRQTRRRLVDSKVLTEEEVWQAVETVPGLERDDFGVCRGEGRERRFCLIAEARERIETDHA